ncbi:MAG TPA: RIP metalloprotease RseP [Desulfomonilia bacterium]|jgi:regulator of sigma E protease
MITTIVAFIILLGILIFFHELGHFLVAKASGVMVLKFSLGFGPSIIKKKIGETEYMISALPLGGYVKMLGEGKQNGEEMIMPVDPSRSFEAKPLRIKAAIVAAGPAFNLVLAFFIYVLVSWIGIPTLSPVIGEVQEKTPAYDAGLMKGDKIVLINSSPVKEWEDIPSIMSNNQTGKLNIVIERNGTQFKVEVRPKIVSAKNLFGENINRPLIGISPSGETFITRYGPISGLGYGINQCWWVVKMTGIAFSKIIEGTVPIKESLGGPIMIAQVSGKSFKAGLLPFLGLIAFISINLAIINILPIPVLDGGYILIFLIEGIIRRPLKDKPKEIAQQIGLFILILLMLFAFYNDIARIIAGK